jgi:ribokinase
MQLVLELQHHMLSLQGAAHHAGAIDYPIGQAMILVFGSINVDLLVPVPHLPLRGETVLGNNYVLLPGGKGANQALAARRASGAVVMMAGAVGNDAFAETALSGLRREGVVLNLVRRADQPTGCAAIMVGESGENLIAVASGANRNAASASVPDSMLNRHALVLCQMEVPPDQNWALLQRTHAGGARAILNLAPAAPIERALLGAIDILVANEGEAASLGGEPAVVATHLRQAFVVTRGAAGATAYLVDGTRIDTPALSIAPVDTTGAGDAFTGVLAASLDERLPLDVALRRASVAAGLACLAHGAQSAMPDRQAIDAALSRLA